MISPAKYVIQPAQNVNLAETNMDLIWFYREQLGSQRTHEYNQHKLNFGISPDLPLRKLGGDSTTVANFAENHIGGHLITNIIG